jgi:hypothetical protein
MTAGGEITWPSAGNFLAAYGEFSVAADKPLPATHVRAGTGLEH